MVPSSRHARRRHAGGVLHALFLLAFGLVYVICLVAVQVSIAAARVIRSGRRRRLDVALVGVGITAAWALGVPLLLVGSGLAHTALASLLVLSSPIALVVGWQVLLWRERIFWSSVPSSLTLGFVRTRPFFVRTPTVVTGPERLKHLTITGPTGSGKSTLLTNLIVADIRSGAGVCVIDPKDGADGLIDRILAHVPREREKDVIFLDALDRERPVGVNPLADVPAEQRSLATGELIAVLRRAFPDSFGPRLEHILTHVVLALLEMPGATLVDIPRLLLDPPFAAQVARHTTNPAVRQFFTGEYAEYARRRSDVFGPILNKVEPWIAYVELRNILGQAQSSFRIREIMDRGQILLVRIPQGAFGESIAKFLGGLIVAQVQLAAHRRMDTPESRRRPFYLYVDEFQNFVTSSFVKILVEARAFRLGLVCANQYDAQLPRELQLAVAHNAGTAVRCHGDRGLYHLEVRHLEDVIAERPPLVVRPLGPLPPGDPQGRARIRALSRSTYGRSREEVEREIVARLSARSPAPQSNERRSRRMDVDEE